MRLCSNTNLTPLSIVAMCPCCNVAILPLSIAKPRALFTVTERVDKRRLLTMSRIFHWSLLCEIFTRYFVEDMYSAWYFCAMAKYIYQHSRLNCAINLTLPVKSITISFGVHCTLCNVCVYNIP